MTVRKTTMGSDIKLIYQGLASIIRGTASIYREITDSVKPKADKIIDSSAVFLASNSIVAGSLYSLNNFAVKPGLERIIGAENMDNMGDFFNSHSTAEFILKGIYYSTVYGIANYKAILPLTKSVFDRNTRPSWLNHAKTWAILAFAATMFNFSEGCQDSKKYINTMHQKGIVHGLVDKGNLRILDKQLSGEGVATASSRTYYHISQVYDYIFQESIESPNVSSKDLKLAMDRAAKEYKLDRALLEAVVWQESTFNTRAISKCGAAGAMQLMPSTAIEEGLDVYAKNQRDKLITRCSQGKDYARLLKAKINGKSDAEAAEIDDRFNPYKNVSAGSSYLRKQIDRFGSVSLGLAAYNAGPDRVKDYGGIPPFRQTRNYVKGISKKTKILKERYGVRQVN